MTILVECTWGTHVFKKTMTNKKFLFMKRHVRHQHIQYSTRIIFMDIEFSRNVEKKEFLLTSSIHGANQCKRSPRSALAISTGMAYRSSLNMPVILFAAHHAKLGEDVGETFGH